MADIKNITIDGTTYDLKDAKAREDVSDLKEDFINTTGVVPIALSSGYIETNVDPVSYSTVKTSSSWLYAIVDCVAGDIFIINGDGAATARLWFFGDASGNKIDVADNSVTYPSNLVLVAPTGATKLVINTRTTAVNKRSYKGNFIPKTIGNTNIALASKINYIANLVDTSASTDGKVINDAAGTLATYSGYSTTDYIPVSKGSYIITPKTRKILCYDANKNAMPYTYHGSEEDNPVINVIDGVGYLRFSYSTSQASEMMIVKGDSTIPYIGYGQKKIEENVGLSESLKTEINNLIDGFVSGSEMSVNINSGRMTLQSKFGGGSICHTFDIITNDRNELPQFYKTDIFDSQGNLIGSKSEDDDITPIRIRYFETVGANHGYPFVFKLAKTGQDSDDIGSIWTDGTTSYLLVYTDDTYVYLLSPAGIYSGNYRPNATAPVADLTASSGATHTTAIPVSGLENGRYQLYPSINNKTTTVFIDGKKVVGDFDGVATDVVIDSEYGIMSYADIWDYLPDHVGEELSDSIADIVTIKERIAFKANGKCTVTTTLIANQNVTLSDCGFLQAQAIAPSAGQQLWRYINGLKPMSGNDFSSFINITSYNSDLVVSSSDFLDATVPPNRLVDWLIASGEKVFGFTLGYIADLADSSNAKRIENCVNDKFWDIRKTKKIYPIAVTGITLSAGESITVCGYRNYLVPSDFVNHNYFEYGNVAYAGLDDDASGTKTFDLDGNYTGRTISVVDDTNASVDNDVVSVGVIETLTDAGGCFVKFT